MADATHVVLLRAINVGGKNKIPMAELRLLLGELGFEDARTYIQSGNIVLVSELSSNDIATQIHAGIQDRFGLDIGVIIRTATEFANAVAACPFDSEDPKTVAASFLESPYVGELDASAFAPDICTVLGAEVHVCCPNTFAKSKLTNNWIEKQTGLAATMRNRNTTKKLLAML